MNTFELYIVHGSDPYIIATYKDETKFECTLKYEYANFSFSKWMSENEFRNLYPILYIGTPSQSPSKLFDILAETPLEYSHGEWTGTFSWDKRPSGDHTAFIKFNCKEKVNPVDYFQNKYSLGADIDYKDYLNDFDIRDSFLIGTNKNSSKARQHYEVKYDSSYDPGIIYYLLPQLFRVSNDFGSVIKDGTVWVNGSPDGTQHKVNWDSFYNLHESSDPNDAFSCIIKQENNYFISSEENGYFMNTSTISTQPNKTPIILTKKNTVPRPCIVEMSSSKNELILKDANGVIVPALNTSTSNSLINLTGTVINNTADAQKTNSIKLCTLVSKVNNQEYEFKGLKIFDSEGTKYLIAEDLNSLGSIIWLKGDTKKEDIKSLCRDTFKSTGIPKTIAGLVWAGGGGGGHGGFAAHYGGGGGGGGCAKVLLSICDDVEYIIALGAGGDGKNDASKSGSIGHGSLIKVNTTNTGTRIALSITGGNGGGYDGTGGPAGEATISTEYVKSKYINATKLIAGRGGNEYKSGGNGRSESSLLVFPGASSNYVISAAQGGSSGGNSGGGGASIGKGGNSTISAGGNGLLGGGGAGCSAMGGTSGDGGPGGCIFWF